MSLNKINIKQIDGLQQQLSKSLSDVLNVGNTASQNILMGTYSVALGTLTPDANLHVEGTFKYVDGTQADGYVLVSNSTGVASWTASTNLTVTGNGIYDGSGTVPSTATASITDTLSFGTDLLHLNETGSRVGINTSSPAVGYALDVRGNAVIGQSGVDTLISFAGPNVDLYGTYANYVNIRTGYRIRLYTYGTLISQHGTDQSVYYGDLVGTSNLIIYNNTSLGAGFTPTARLHVNGSVRIQGLTSSPVAGYVLQAADSNGNLDWVDVNTLTSAISFNDLSDVSIIGATTGQTLKYNGSNWVNQSDLIIDSMGNVGIGVSSPDSKLHVVGDIIADNIILPSYTWTVDLVDLQTYNIYAPYDFSMATYSQIYGSASSYTFTDDGVTYSLGATVSQGSKFTITSDVPSVLNLIINK